MFITTETQSKLTDFLVLKRTHPAEGRAGMDMHTSTGGGDSSPPHESAPSAISGQGDPSLPLFLRELIDWENYEKTRPADSDEPVRGGDKQTVRNPPSSLDEGLTVKFTAIPSTPPMQTVLARSRKTQSSLHHIKYRVPISGSFSPRVEEKEGRDYNTVTMRNWPRPKYVYEYAYMKKTVNLHCLEITFELDPLGDRVKEKVDSSRETAERVARVFASSHGMELTGTVELCRGKESPHVLIGDKKIDLRLKKRAEAKPKLNLRTGYQHGDSSHPGQGELKGPESIEAGEGIDDMFIDFPEHLPSYIDALYKGQIAFRQDVKILLGAWGTSIEKQTRIEELLSKLLSRDVEK